MEMLSTTKPSPSQIVPTVNNVTFQDSFIFEILIKYQLKTFTNKNGQRKFSYIITITLLYNFIYFTFIYSISLSY